MAEGFAPTVIDSQVLDTLVALEREGVRHDLVAMVSPGELLRNLRPYRERRRAYARRIAGRVLLVPALRLRNPKMAATEAAFIAAALADRLAGRVVVHARNHTAALVGAVLRRVHPAMRLVLDVRGDALAEYRLTGERFGDDHARRSVDEVAGMVTRAVAASDAVLCVSSPLRDLLIQRHGAGPLRTHIIACLADETKFRWDPALRGEVRRREGLEGRRVLIFAGSTGRWHYVEPTLAVVRRLLDADPLATFVALTPDIAGMQALAERHLPPGRWLVRRARHDEVPGWLNAADFGLLMRERHPVNAVAAPTKFAEYMLCGLPTLISPEIGDYSGYVAAERCGVLVDEAAPDQVVRDWQALAATTGEAQRQRIAEAARPRFGKAAGIPRMAELYRSLWG